MPILYKRTNILDPDSWAVGSGGTGAFGQNGSTNENERVIGTDPFGNSAVVWESRPNGSADADGGWGTGWYDVDEFSLYRWSVWVKRTTSSAGGTHYLGLYGNPNAVIRIDNGSQEGNPYWECVGTGNYTQNVWYLVVGHCFPSNYTGGATRHPDSGRYTTSGRNGDTNQCNIGGDVKWYPGTTGGYHRTYHYYCGDNTTRLQWFDPRLDKCDGSEPTISDLLNNRQAKLESTTITVEGASHKTQRIVATGGVITTVGEYRIHRFNSSSSFTISSLRSSSIEVEYLIVGGGGGGGTNMGGGGGGGGVLVGNTILTPGTYTITVGAGGAGAPAGTTGVHPTVTGSNGGNSTFNGLTAFGGGWGGVSYNTQGLGIHFGNSGGSGGGSSGYNNDGAAPGAYGSGAGVSGQGFRGGYQGNAYYSGGGGGAGSAGTDGNNRPDGGFGKLTGILGKPFYFGGGGGGASYSLSTGGYGGLGGGGGGALGVAPGGTGGLEWGQAGGGGACCTWANTPGGNGGTNTGGGGGGGAHYNATNKGGDGGSGIVIIRYKYR
jgi:hypothetical protein